MRGHQAVADAGPDEAAGRMFTGWSSPVSEREIRRPPALARSGTSEG